MDPTDAESYCGTRRGGRERKRKRNKKNKRDAINSGLERGLSIHEDGREGWCAHLGAVEAAWLAEEKPMSNECRKSAREREIEEI